MSFSGLLTRLLSSRIFLPFGRLSYMISLIHAIIAQLKIASLRTPNFFSPINSVNYLNFCSKSMISSKKKKMSSNFQLQSFWTTFCLTLIVAFILSILFELPVIQLEQLMIKRKDRKKLLLDDDKLGHKV